MRADLAQYGLRLLIGREDVTAYVGDGLTFSSVDPGGFEALDVEFARAVRPGQGEAVLLQSGLATAWEGRVAEREGALAGAATTRVPCEGQQARLADSDLAVIFVDRDLSQWQEDTIANQILYAWTPRRYFPPEIGQDQLEPAVITTITGPTQDPDALSLARYEPGPDARIGRVAYTFRRAQVPPASADASWIFRVSIGAQDTGDLQPPTGIPRPESGEIAADSGATAILELSKTTALTDQRDHKICWTHLAVYGDHGLPIRGELAADGSDQERGLFSSDVMRYLLDHVGGLEPGVIEESAAFVIPQLVFRELVAHRELAEQANRFAGWHWGVWEREGILGSGVPRLDFRRRPDAPTAWVDRSDCDELSASERLAALYDRARVRYTTPAGKERSVLVERPVPELADLGIERTLPVDGGTLVLDRQAELLGDLALRVAEAEARSAGSVELPASVRTRAGHRPAHMLRAGLDKLAITDLSPGMLDQYHLQRVESRVGDDGVKTSAEFGLGANLLELIGARLETVGEAVGVS